MAYNGVTGLTGTQIYTTQYTLHSNVNLFMTFGGVFQMLFNKQFKETFVSVLYLAQ